MVLTSSKPRPPQLSLPGIPAPLYASPVADGMHLAAGQSVLYLGRISGGPPYGCVGTVRQSLRGKAVVDLGLSGTWQIPYYFLGLPEGR